MSRDWAKLSLVISTVILAGCFGPLEPIPYVLTKEDIHFGLNSCVLNKIECSSFLNKTKIQGLVSYYDSDGSRYYWASSAKLVEKEKWLAKRWKNSECIVTVPPGGPCWLISADDPIQKSVTHEGDIFALKERYETGNRKMPSLFDIMQQKDPQTSSKTAILTELAKWDYPTKRGASK